MENEQPSFFDLIIETHTGLERQGPGNSDMPEIKDYKKERKDLYLPKNKPMLIDVPEMQFVAVEGKGNPNDESGEYKKWK